MGCIGFSKLTNQLSDSQYESVIMLLPKPEKFILCVECLVIMLRQSRQYKGITLNKQIF